MLEYDSRERERRGRKDVLFIYPLARVCQITTNLTHPCPWSAARDSRIKAINKEQGIRVSTVDLREIEMCCAVRWSTQRSQFDTKGLSSYYLTDPC